MSELTRFLSFSLGTEEYAIPLLTVREVIAVPEFTPLPFSPSYFLGLMNLRGQVISVLDLRTKFGITPSASTENAVIICDLGTTEIGVLVDSVNSVLCPSASEMSERPDTQGQKAAEVITAVFRNKDHLVLQIDIAKTLSNEDRTAAARASQPVSKSA